MKSLKEYVNFFKTSAYLFKNNFYHKWQYFIPLADYDEIILDEEFDQETPTVIVKDSQVVTSIKKLIGKPFLMGDPNIFIVPLMYDERPLIDVFTKNCNDKDLFKPKNNN